MSADEVDRFDVVTRVVHWSTAVLGLAALGTGTVLYVPELSAAVGLRAVVKNVHVVSGLLCLVPVVVGAALGPTGRRLRRDVSELGRWTASDRRWVRRRTRGLPGGKFNGGQKLVTALFAGLLVLQYMTGSVMYWHDPFTDSWRTGATFVHDWAFIGLAIATLGHVIKAIGEPELLGSMWRGTVPRAWAARERPGWRGPAPSGDAPPDRGIT